MEATILDMHRIVHFDMKGAPPKISYLERLFPLLRSWGATGLLVEWEDTFPYAEELGDLGSLSAARAPTPAPAPYTPRDAARILQLAQQNDLVVIQLMQSLGHLEFVLKHASRRELREEPEFPSSMCPSCAGALPLVRAMLTQALRLQPYARYLHIGADEVWHMGACEACRRRAAESAHGAAALFLEHVVAVVGFVHSNYPDVTVIMWDDMLRRLPLHTLQAYALGSLVQPMVWHYPASDAFQLDDALWDKYAQLFPDVWVASAFKGASGSCQIIPSVEHHVSNQECWRRELRRHGGRFRSVRGVALTGWSRYDHYATLCELLPASLPSLACCLAAWPRRPAAPAPSAPPAVPAGDPSRVRVQSEAARMLGCELAALPAPERATFPGWQAAAALLAFVRLRDLCRHLVHGDTVQTWLNPWQVARGFTNPMQTRCILAAATQLLGELSDMEQRLASELGAVLSDGLDEWLGSNIAPLRSQLTQLRDTIVASGTHSTAGEGDSSVA